MSEINVSNIRPLLVESVQSWDSKESFFGLCFLKLTPTKVGTLFCRKADPVGPVFKLELVELELRHKLHKRIPERHCFGSNCVKGSGHYW